MAKETKKKIEIEIEEDDFEAYEDCRRDGLTNMLHVKNVESLTGLSREKILYIMKHYEELEKKFS
tara:strand:- start:2151 stop:2345 length:195 start_codon:yes stop_codon:yes gene_type:complete